MPRSGQPGRVPRVAAAIHVAGGALRRLLLVGGFVIAAWLFGSAAASADELGADPSKAGAASDEVAQQAETVAGTGPGRDTEEIGRSADEAAQPATEATEEAETAGSAEAATEFAHGAADTDATALVDMVNENGNELLAGSDSDEDGAAGDAAARMTDILEQQETGRAEVDPQGGSPAVTHPRTHTHAVDVGAPADRDAGAIFGSAAQQGQDHAAIHTPLGSAQAQSGSVMSVYAGLLPVASVVPPDGGLHEAARQALFMVPPNPVDELTVSPD